MPYPKYRDKEKRRKYLRNYHRKYRHEQRLLKERFLAENQNIEELQREFPNIYKLIFGSKKRRRKK